jgi:DNA adenine methylase
MIMNAKPFLKWAGGKGQLLSQFETLYPPALALGSITTYVEPFVGGGAVFFDLASRYQFERIIINDINEELGIAYKVIKTNVFDLIEYLTQLERDYLALPEEQRKNLYYSLRKKFNEQKLGLSFKEICKEWIEFASLLIFLNKTCFNGLFRLNSKGGFNVPMGSYKNPVICHPENLMSVHKLLQNTTILNQDFATLSNEEYIKNPQKTFVYIDPPYRPLSKSSSFNSYQANAFDDDEQIRLAAWYQKLTRLGCYVMLSNSDPTSVDPSDLFFEKLYGNYFINKVYATRIINSNAEKRNAITEIVVANYSIPYNREDTLYSIEA